MLKQTKYYGEGINEECLKNKWGNSVFLILLRECDSIWYIVGGCSKHNMYVFDLKCFIGSYL